MAGRFIDKNTHLDELIEDPEIKIINLKSIGGVRTLSCHKGPIHLSVSNQFITNGSALPKRVPTRIFDPTGYIWDKSYRILLAMFPRSYCVTCNPTDEEMCVTASMDDSDKIWPSQRKERLQ